MSDWEEEFVNKLVQDAFGLDTSSCLLPVDETGLCRNAKLLHATIQTTLQYPKGHSNRPPPPAWSVTSDPTEACAQPLDPTSITVSVAATKPCRSLDQNKNLKTSPTKASYFKTNRKRAKQHAAKANVFQASCGLKWREVKSIPNQDPSAEKAGIGNSITKKLTDLEMLLHLQSESDPTSAVNLLMALLNLKQSKRLKELLIAKLSKDTVESTIVDGMAAFIKHHETRGSRLSDEQAAMDAVYTAACFAIPAFEEDDAEADSAVSADSPAVSSARTDSAISKTGSKSATRRGVTSGPKISKRLGVHSRVVYESKRRAGEMILDGSKFKREVRLKHGMSPTRQCVWDFCHSDRYTSPLEADVGCSGKKCCMYKVQVQDYDGTVREERHPLRKWRVQGHAKRREQFHASDIYKIFKMQNPGKTIGETTWYKYQCNCVVGEEDNRILEDLNPP
jgi:hypothetical protein